MKELAISKIVGFWAESQGERVAVYHAGETITWNQLERETNKLARAYESLGVGQDDFVTLALPNGIEFFKSAIATWKLGATPQPVSSKLPRFELEQIIELAKPALIIGVSGESAKNRPSLGKNFVPGQEFSDKPLPEKVAESFKVMTSGGSTGRPKLIVSGQDATWDIDSDEFWIQLKGSILIPGPLYHNGPFLWAMSALFRGNQVTLTSKFDPLETLRLVEEQNVDILYLVPTMMHRIWNLSEADRLSFNLSSLKVLWHLASPCPEWLKERFIDWLGPETVWELYGGTEGQGGTMISGHEWLSHRGSVGKSRDDCEIKIVNAEGESVEPNTLGEVYMRPLSGQGSTYRYIGAEPRAIEDGFESIGDLGYLDPEGYLYLADRRTDMILCGGANVYPAEVEGAIDSFQGIRSSAVIGLPHDDLGNVVHAIIDAPSGLNQSEFMEHLSERLARYKIPRSIELVTEPLRDEAGKLRRKALREARLGQKFTFLA